MRMRKRALKAYRRRAARQFARTLERRRFGSQGAASDVRIIDSVGYQPPLAKKIIEQPPTKELIDAKRK